MFLLGVHILSTLKVVGIYILYDLHFWLSLAEKSKFTYTNHAFMISFPKPYVQELNNKNKYVLDFNNLITWFTGRQVWIKVGIKIRPVL